MFSNYNIFLFCVFNISFFLLVSNLVLLHFILVILHSIFLLLVIIMEILTYIHNWKPRVNRYFDPYPQQ